MRLRWLLVAVGLSLSVGCLGGCGKDETSKSDDKDSADKDKKDKKKSAILKKKIAELTEDDLKKAATELGWGDKPTSTHSKGANETIIVSASKEHPDGTDSPDGKKRVRMSVGLYIEKDEAAAEVQKKSLEGRDYVVKVEGSRVVATQFYTAKGADKKKSQEIMDQLFGK